MLAGDVTAILGARVNPAGFVAYDAALGRATASATKAEAAQVKHTAAMTTGASAAGRFGSVARTGAAAGAVVLAAAMAKSVAVAADFESQMDRVKAVTQASGRDMKAMTAIARDLGKKTGLGATEAARGLEALAKGGLTTKQIIGGGLAGALALAQAGQMDVAQAAETTANALNLFGLSGSQATHVADAMATAANATTADVSDFAMALTQAGAAAKVSGLSFDETIVALESLAKIGVKGSDAGTSLKAALLQTINPTKEAAAAMRRYGIDFTDAQGKMKPLGTVAEMLQSKLGGLTKEQKIAALQAMAGTDGFRALAALMEQGGEGVDKLSGGLKKSGEAARVARENTDNLNGAWDKFKAQLQDIAIVAGTPLLEGLTDGLEAVTGWLDGLGGNEDVKQLADDIGYFAGKIADFLDAIDAGKGVGGYLSGVVENLSNLIHALRQFAEGDFSGAFDSLKKAAAGVVNIWRPMGEGIAEAISAPVQGAVAEVIGWLSSLVGAYGSVMGALAKVPGPMQGAFKAAAAAADAAKGKLDGLGDSMDAASRRSAGLHTIREALEDIPDKKRTAIELHGDQNVLAKVGQILQKVKGTPDEKRIKAILEGDAPVKVKLAALSAIARGRSIKTVSAIVTGDAPARVKIVALNALAAGVSPARVRAIVTGDGTAKQKLNALTDAVNSVPSSKTILLNAVGNAEGRVRSLADALANARARAAGRPAGSPELALVGEGRNPREAVVSPSGGWAMVTSGPTLMGLPADAYVIPEDPAYRGRALGFLGMLAEDLGLRGFKKGKAPAKRSAAKQSQPLGLPNPAQLTPTTLPLADLEDKERKARETLNDAKQKVHDLPGSIRDKRKQIKDIQGRNAKSPETKAKKARDLNKAQGELQDLQRSLAANRKAEPKRRAEWKQLAADLKQAKRYQAAITKTETLADVAAKQMATANAAGDRGGWDAAKGRRSAALKTLQTLLAKARDVLGDKNSQAAADLERAIAENAGDLQSDSTEVFDTPDTADEALSEDEKRRLANLDRDVALAALTEGVGDDLSAAESREKFLSGLLNAAVGGGRSAPVVTELADMVKTARENIKAFSSSSATNENADLQAQIDQQRARADLAEQNARLNAQTLAAFSGYGDIGTGGVNVTVNTLHPGDPRTLTAIGQAAAAGFGFQGGISSPRTAVG